MTEDDFDIKNLENLDSELFTLNSDLWKMLTPFTENREDVMMASAILLKTAIQMYTVVMTDEDIAGLLSHEVCESIPELREGFQKQLTRTLH
jgi:hypothetical protein